MSTWFSSFSLPNTFKFDSDDDGGNGDGDDPDYKPSTENHSPTPSSLDSPRSPSAGVRSDLSALSQSVSHHLREVTAFLAALPEFQPFNSVVDNYTSTNTTTRDDYVTAASSSSETITGIKKDLVEIGGSFKSLFSSSSNKAVTGISKFASNILHSQNDGVVHEDDEKEESQDDTAGINQEVVDFVREVSLRPQLWTDFPIPLPNDFDMSDGQREHAETIEHLVPSLVTLRQTCRHLSDGQFWMIYFILLLPRLNEIEMELLSTSEIVEVRETLLQKLQKKKNAQVETSDISETVNSSGISQEISGTQGDESLSRQKDVSAETANSTGEREVETGKIESKLKDEDTVQGKLKDEDTVQGKSLISQKHSENEDDVSFSDLEDDDNGLSKRVSGFRLTQSGRSSSASESNEWVRLTENPVAQDGQNKSGLSTKQGRDSEGEESNEWLTVDDIDLDSLAAV